MSLSTALTAEMFAMCWLLGLPGRSLDDRRRRRRPGHSCDRFSNTRSHDCARPHPCFRSVFGSRDAFRPRYLKDSLKPSKTHSGLVGSLPRRRRLQLFVEIGVRLFSKEEPTMQTRTTDSSLFRSACLAALIGLAGCS